MGAGYIWDEVYAFAAEHGHIAVGGGDRVGITFFLFGVEHVANYDVLDCRSCWGLPPGRWTRSCQP